ncbi:MAG: hypothetical protein HOM14_17370 [Gammaproteobacteria bacterium]|jgi:hypothetical protein|nr:hypothetical protein [Gammaproteobacteria bacterium]MBT3722743.1 hypothetical protein [Gammaproteobacteria bacterium]MBT4078620.1 hypothetical protein [Gammaproteobacteria bacterium]MBT4193745.1 hypothetical protein [Gammaproteobacteria bacterium]MBT4451888.1 hypothetical protein [Gammaproteobacteria bacterium]
MSEKNILPPGRDFNSAIEPDTRKLCDCFDEECLQKRLNGTLEELIYHAYFNQDFADKLCERVSNFARGDRHKVAIIKKFAVAGSGRYPQKSLGHDFLLLVSYANNMIHLGIDNYMERENVVINKLIQDHKEKSGVEISFESMQNNISKAIRTEGNNEKLSWAREVIDKRIARGKKRNK